MEESNKEHGPDLTLNASLRDVVVDGRRANLTENEYRVMELLATEPGKAFARSTLALTLGSDDARVVDSHVKNIRAKLHEDARNPRWLKTEHGMGYRLDLPDEHGGRESGLGSTSQTFRAATGDATLAVNDEYHRVVLDGRDIHTTTSEYHVLLTLVSHAGETLDKESLSQEALGVGFTDSGRLLASHIKNLRKKLEDSARDPRWIATVHGIGFRFVGEALDAAPEPTSPLLDELEKQLADRLATSLGNIIVWHDPDGSWEDLVTDLQLPDGTRLLREEPDKRFALLLELYGAAPDEQVIVYRRRRTRVEEGDWLADVESYASPFDPEPAEEAEVTDEAGLGSTGGAPAEPGMSATDVARIAEVLDHDWYTPQGFDDAVQASCERAGRHVGAENLRPWQLGFRPFGDCVLRNTWRAPGDYYATLVTGALVPVGSVPEEVRSTPSFSQFVSSSIMAGTLFPYDADTWITATGLAELDIAPEDLDAFARDAVRASVGAGIPQFTVPWLRAHASELALLAYGLDDSFYESVLLSRRRLATRGHLGGRRIFAEPHAQARGRDLVESLVQSELSMDVEELLDVLRDDYGIPVQRPQLVSLMRATNLFFSPELDRVYASHDQFVREVE